MSGEQHKSWRLSVFCCAHALFLYKKQKIILFVKGLKDVMTKCMVVANVSEILCMSTFCVLFFIASEVGLSPLHCRHFWPIVPAPDDRWGWFWSNWWNEDWQGKPKYSEKTCPSATLSTTNATWPDPGSNPSRRGGKPATNRLSYGAALRMM
jgi:hypothetical protein